VDIVAALFVEQFDIRQDSGGSARLDLTGVHFSLTAPTEFPVSLEPHLLVLVRCPTDSPGFGALEVRFMAGDDEVARNVQPLEVEPGKFNYRLIRGELTWDAPGTIEAHCRIDQGAVMVIPLTVNAA